jgi:hypothetical protein
MRASVVVVVLLLCFVSPSGTAQTTNCLAGVAISDTLAAEGQQSSTARILSGVIISQQNELLPGVTLVIRSSAGVQETTSDTEGNFRLEVPRETF